MLARSCRRLHISLSSKTLDDPGDYIAEALPVGLKILRRWTIAITSIGFSNDPWPRRRPIGAGASLFPHGSCSPVTLGQPLLIPDVKFLNRPTRRVRAEFGGLREFHMAEARLAAPSPNRGAGAVVAIRHPPHSDKICHDFIFTPSSWKLKKPRGRAPGGSVSKIEKDGTLSVPSFSLNI